ncbi:hypothetical protein ABZU94_13925 [Streptomyces mirabilis]|uniref:hypothetical protein n=1 Tax=Streptomyces sp. NPDC005388 TaxID=3156717 RepID=UPI0033A0D7BE
MSRRKGRKRRQRPAQRPGDVYLRIEGGPADGLRVKVPGFTADQYGQVQELAQAGRIHDPLIMRFIRAFASTIGHDIDASPAQWTDVDTLELLRWLEFVPETEWTALDDVEFAQLLGGGS